MINPLSHTPDTVKQFKIAGLSIDAPLPSKIYPGFPHRSIPPPRVKTSRNKWERFYSDEVDAGDTDSEGYGSTNSQDESETGNEDGNNNDLIQVDAGVSDDEEEERIPGRRRRRRQSPKQDQPQGRTKRSLIQREPGLAAAERAQAHQKHVGGLLQIIERGLMEGNITTAKRAFGLLVRSKVYGTPVDLRYADYWKLGLDILLREGEEEDNRRRKRRRRRLRLRKRAQLSGNMGGQQEEEEDDETEGFDGEEEDGLGDDEDEEEVEYKFARRRAADVLTKVKGYYETLIKLFPYNRLRPAALSSLFLYPAMFQFELNDVRTEYDQGLQRLERIRSLGGFGDEEDEDNYNEREELEGQQYGDDAMMDVDDPKADHRRRHHYTLRMGKSSTATTPRGIIDRPADKLRLKALDRLTDIAYRMDQILPNLPFKKDYTLLSLRAEIALLMADLSVPCLLEKEATTASATTTKTTTTTATTTTDGNERSPSPSQQLQEEQDRHRRSSSPEPEEHEDPHIKYGFEQERAQVQEGKILRHKAQMKVLKIFTSMKKTAVKKGGLLDKEDEAVFAKLRKELLHDDKVIDGGKREERNNDYSGDSETGNGSDKECGSQDGDDEAGGERLTQDQNQKKKKKKKRQKENEMGDGKKKRKEAKTRRVAKAGGSLNMSTSTTTGKGMFSSLPIR